jgi:opacity protein-like surface antigen
VAAGARRPARDGKTVADGGAKGGPMLGRSWHGGWCIVSLAVALLAPVPSRGEDGQRYYLNLRFGESMPFVRAHDAVGLSFGANLDSHFGLELAADFYELFLDVPGVGKVGEVGTALIVPQIRLRHAFLEDRLVPYAAAGVGVALMQINDRTLQAAGRSMSLGDAAFVGAVGGGVEYLVADNVGLGLEGKYVMSTTRTLRFGGDRQDFDVNTGLLSLSMRLLYPQLAPSHGVDPGGSGPGSFYIGLRAGLAYPVHHHVFGPVTAEPEPASVGPLDQLYGAALGMTIGRYVGVEIPFEGYEMQLELPGFGPLGEYALYSVVPQARFRYPVLDRVWPYALGGVGISFGEFNDPAPGTQRIGFVHGEDDYGIAGVLGSGIEWFLATNICLTGEVRYLFARGHSLRIGDSTQFGGNLDSLLLSLGLRVFLFEFGNGG